LVAAEGNDVGFLVLVADDGVDFVAFCGEEAGYVAGDFSGASEEDDV